MPETGANNSSMRWGQLNTKQPDPLTMDVETWASWLRDTHADVTIINAGGIVAYYPTKLPWQEKSPFLGDRDLLGEQVAKAREIGVIPIARLDVGQIHPRAFYEHPDWVCRDSAGQPVSRSQGLYACCINGPYYWECAPQLMREVLENYDVDGFFDNGWPPLPRSQGPCYCANCRRLFREATGLELPKAVNWDDPAFKRWVDWRYERALAVWQFFWRTVKSIKPTATWRGNLIGDTVDMAERSLDWKTMSDFSEVIGADFQGRGGTTHPLWTIGETCRIMRSVARGRPFYNGSGQYQNGRPSWRLSAKPAAEAKLWFAGAVACNARIFWHVVGAHQEDQRWKKPTVEFYDWHFKNNEHLREQDSLASVGVVFSPRTVDFYGRENPVERWREAFRGMQYALLQQRIPFDLVHERLLDAESLARYDTLVLPNIAVLDDAKCAQLRDFVARGGNLVATYETSLYDEWGVRRNDFGLAGVLGVRALGDPTGPYPHSYMRIVERHPALAGFEETNVLPNEGMLLPAEATRAASVPLTLVPPFPWYPPETAWPPIPVTTTPMAFYSEQGRSRVVYFPGEPDHLMWKYMIPDHATLLGNAVRWAARGALPVEVSGPGVVDVQPYRAGARTNVHLVNYSNTNTWKATAFEVLPVGEQVVRLRDAAGRRCAGVRALVSEQALPFTQDERGVEVRVPSVGIHEVLVFDWQ